MICKENVEAPLLHRLDTLILHPLFYWEYVAIREEKEGKRQICITCTQHNNSDCVLRSWCPCFLFTIQSHPIIQYKKMRQKQDLIRSLIDKIQSINKRVFSLKRLLPPKVLLDSSLSNHYPITIQSLSNDYPMTNDYHQLLIYFS